MDLRKVQVELMQAANASHFDLIDDGELHVHSEP